MLWLILTKISIKIMIKITENITTSSKFLYFLRDKYISKNPKLVQISMTIKETIGSVNIL